MTSWEGSLEERGDTAARPGGRGGGRHGGLAVRKERWAIPWAARAGAEGRLRGGRASEAEEPKWHEEMP